MPPVYEDDLTYLDSDSEDSSDTIEVEEIDMSRTNNDEEENSGATKAK